MLSYRVFGLRIDTEIPLPELDPVRHPNGPDWTVRVARENPATVPLSSSGSDIVYGDVQVHAYSSSTGLRLAFDDTGTFDIRLADRVIAWHPGPAPSEAAVRADLLGRVLAAAAHLSGQLALHASAVSIGGAVVAFVGPKHAGKSTLALALVRRGARLVTDDTLVVRLGERDLAWAAPGVQRVRLWDDAARALGIEPRPSAGTKPTIDRLTPGELERSELPLAACYVLQSAASGEVQVAARRPMSPVQAAVAYVRFSKLGALAGGKAGQALLERAAQLTHAVAVLELVVRRDLEALDEVATTIAGWHCAPSASRVVANR